MVKIPRKERKLNNVSFRVNEIDLDKIEYYCKENNIQKSKLFYDLVMNEVNNFCDKQVGLFETLETSKNEEESLNNILNRFNELIERGV